MTGSELLTRFSTVPFALQVKLLRLGCFCRIVAHRQITNMLVQILSHTKPRRKAGFSSSFKEYYSSVASSTALRRLSSMFFLGFSAGFAATGALCSMSSS